MRARVGEEEQFATSGCLSISPSLPAISWPFADKQCWRPARAGGFPRKGVRSGWVHTPDLGGSRQGFQALLYPFLHLTPWTQGPDDSWGGGVGTGMLTLTCGTLTRDGSPTEKDPARLSSAKESEGTASRCFYIQVPRILEHGSQGCPSPSEQSSACRMGVCYPRPEHSFLSYSHSASFHKELR